MDMIRIQKQEVIAEGSKMLEQTNTTEDFMDTLSHKKTKDEVFAKYKNQFTQHYAKNGAFEEEKQQLSGQIQSQMQSFHQILSQSATDPVKTKFFEQLHQAIVIQEQLGSMNAQGNTFYL